MSRFSKWSTWIDEIRDEVAQVVISRHIYREVVSIVQLNRAIQIHSSFYGWIHRNYVHDSVMTLRRHVDPKAGTRGLRKLLDEIAQSPGDLTIDAFVALWPREKNKHQNNEMKEVAKTMFQRELGTGATAIRRDQVKADVKLLEAALDQAKHYNNVAHLGARTRKMPSATEVSDAIDTLEKVYQRYKWLLTAQKPSLLPTWQYDWKKIFRVAWIKS